MMKTLVSLHSVLDWALKTYNIESYFNFFFFSVDYTLTLWLWQVSLQSVCPFNMNLQHICHHYKLPATTNREISFFQASAEQVEIRERQLSRLDWAPVIFQSLTSEASDSLSGRPGIMSFTAALGRDQSAPLRGGL